MQILCIFVEIPNLSTGYDMLYQLYFLIFIGTPTITVSGQKSLTTFITGGVGGAGRGGLTYS